MFKLLNILGVTSNMKRGSKIKDPRNGVLGVEEEASMAEADQGGAVTRVGVSEDRGVVDVGGRCIG